MSISKIQITCRTTLDLWKKKEFKRSSGSFFHQDSSSIAYLQELKKKKGCEFVMGNSSESQRSQIARLGTGSLTRERLTNNIFLFIKI